MRNRLFLLRLSCGLSLLLASTGAFSSCEKQDDASPRRGADCRKTTSPTDTTKITTGGVG